MGELSEDGPDDIEGLDASAAHIANLLSTEPAGSKLHDCILPMKIIYSFIEVIFSKNLLRLKDFLKINESVAADL